MIIAYRSSPGQPLSLVTAFPIAAQAAAKEDSNTATREEAQHRRWLGGPLEPLPSESEQFSVPDTSKALVTCPSALAWVGAPERFTSNCKLGDGEGYKRHFMSPVSWSQHDGTYYSSIHSGVSRSLFLEVMERYVPVDTIEDNFAIVEELPGIAIFHCCLGDRDSAALYSSTAIGVINRFIEPEDLVDLLKRDEVDTNQLCAFVGTENVLDAEQLKSIRCLSIASALYDQMPGARVNLDATQHTIHTCRWVQDGLGRAHETLTPLLSRKQAFACIA
ncbi:hypothetical protein CLCR_07500 [Cladophialophora carrionii]|uniref:Uncharacterized protein n=1 Tax=Cladophialophora carrionii TaxID=86049 RepID=A0A1C1CMP5_9EURO|nr:hypothetical protein CLCR_07500 [Cladophialophora carrionii]